MKLTNTRISKNKSGMTLLELTVVILVLLSLISILFVGARAWKKGSDRAGCILNIRNVQQAVRGYINTHPGLGAPAEADIYTTDGTAYMKTPACPASGVYSYAVASADPAPGTIFLTCGLAASDEHVPAGDTSDW
jgi:prepilin-type N-terminal cleavage/methylation domain-containing protein